MATNYSNHLFDQIGSIVTKTQKFDRDYIEEHYIGGFLIRRWLTFIFPEYKYMYFKLINRINAYQFDDKYEDYLFHYHVFPSGMNKYSFKNAYIKRVTKNLTKEEAHLKNISAILAESLDISEKDAKLIIDHEDFDKSSFKELSN